MTQQFERVKRALADLAAGKMIILLDDDSRENEGDLIVAAEKITASAMNFMIRQGSGIVCLALTSGHAEKLQLPLMVPYEQNNSAHATPFTVSIDAKEGITTGVSANDRVKTVLDALQGNANSLVRPGHMFPLQAREGGVLERRGHTEGAVDLAHLAGCQSAAVICEIMNPDGTMACGKQLDDFAEKHQLSMLSIEDIVAYRMQCESFSFSQTSANLPIAGRGEFEIIVFRDEKKQETHVVLKSKVQSSDNQTLVRMHSACMTGDIFGSLRCDCGEQLDYSLKRIADEGGVLIYLDQEGRGIGLFDKIRAYQLQQTGLDTVQANEALGLPVDARRYAVAAHILKLLDISHVRLLTNNSNKIFSLKRHGMKHVTREAIPAFDNEHNLRYLETKNAKLNHAINIKEQYS